MPKLPWSPKLLWSPQLPWSPRRWSRRRTVLSITLAAALILTGAAAWAYFSATTYGTAASATPTELTLTTGTPSSSLYPGSSTSLNVRVSNSNNTPIQFTTVSLDIYQGTNGFAVDSTHSTAGCTVAAASLTFATQNTGWTIAASTANVALSFPATVLAMGATASSACQGATFTVYLRAY